MGDTLNRSEKLGTERSGSDNSIASTKKIAPILIASILLTFAIAQILTATRKWLPIDYLVSIVRNEKTDVYIYYDNEMILGLVANIKHDNINNITNVIVNKSKPEKLSDICEFLINRKDIPHAQELAVMVAEAGAKKYGIPNLIHRAGIEYYLGRFVKRDYQKAKVLLGNPILRVVPYSQYFLGELLAAQDNPQRDIKLAVEKLEFAAVRGVEEAKLRLAQIKAQED